MRIARAFNWVKEADDLAFAANGHQQRMNKVRAPKRYSSRLAMRKCLCHGGDR